MRVAFSTILALWVVLMAWASAAGAFVMAERSPHGISYSRVFLPGADEVSIAIMFPMDWSWRDDENQNVPDVACDAIVHSGVAGLTPAETKEKLADLGATIVFRPHADEVDTYLTVRKENLRSAIDMAASMMSSPRYDPVWTARARSRLEKGFVESWQDANFLVKATAEWAILGDVPMRRALVGESSDRILGISVADLERWHGSVFRRSGLFVSIAGDIDDTSAGEAVDELLSNLPDGGRLLHDGLAPNATPRLILLHSPEAKKSVLAFFGPRPPLTSKAEDRLIQDAINDSDGGLFTALRSQLGATYSISMDYIDFGAAHRFIWISGEIETAKLALAELAFRTAYRTFRRNGVSTLDDRKSWLIRSYDHDLSSTDDSVYQMTVVHDYGGSGADTFGDLVARVTGADVARRLASYPKASEFLVVAVSPDVHALPGACVITKPEQAVNCK